MSSAPGTLHRIERYELPELSAGETGRSLLRDAGGLATACARLGHALATAEATYGSHHPLVGVILRHFGCVLHDLGAPEEGGAMLERALAVHELSHGTVDAEVALDLQLLGRVLRNLGDSHRAQQRLERAVRVDEECHGRKHPTVAADLRHLSRVLQDAGALPEARLSCERAVVIDSQSYGRRHPLVAVDLRYLGHILWDMGDRYAADHCFAKSQAIDAGALESGGPSTILSTTRHHMPPGTTPNAVPVTVSRPPRRRLALHRRLPHWRDPGCHSQMAPRVAVVTKCAPIGRSGGEGSFRSLRWLGD